jgi:hypothetical protein
MSLMENLIKPQNPLAQEPLDASKNTSTRRGISIPQVTIKTGLTTPDGREELLTEYLCDHPGCPNIATQVLGCVRDVRFVAVVCEEHSPQPRS